MSYFYPVTPGGTLLINLVAKTEEKAWQNLLIGASHMPYEGIEGFKERGYTIEEYDKKI